MPSKWPVLWLGGALVLAVLLFVGMDAGIVQAQGASETPTPVFAYTYHNPDGNRYVAGQGALPDVEPLDISLSGVPVWVVAVPGGMTDEDGSLWVAVLENGQVQVFHVVDGEVAAVEVTPEFLPPGMPPLLRVDDGVPSLVTAPGGYDASPLTHPIVLADGRLVFIEANGDVVFWSEEVGESARYATDALPDARIVVGADGLLRVLNRATTYYDHGVLGDAIEAGGIAFFDPDDPENNGGYVLGAGEFGPVIEGIAPILADLDGDGVDESIITLSDPLSGARIVASGAEGPAIGRGYRWRHQIAVAPFGPEGELELAAVLTPHIGGVVEFYRMEGDELLVVPTVGGFTSHVIGTRNLDMAVAGDFDGDGRVELLLPDQARTHLGGIGRSQEGAKVAWTIPVGGLVVTNLAAVTLPDGRLGAGVGREDGVLRVWIP